VHCGDRWSYNIQETGTHTSDLSRAIISLESVIGLSFKFVADMAKHKVEVTMFEASPATTGLIETRRKSNNISLRKRPNTWSEYLKHLGKIAPKILHLVFIFAESSAGAAHLVRATVFDSCRFIEQS